MAQEVVRAEIRAYLTAMTERPAFLDSSRPDVPDLAVPRGITPFYLPQRPVRGRFVRLGPLANTLLARHDHPEPVKILLGQALALAARPGHRAQIHRLVQLAGQRRRPGLDAAG